MPLVNDKPMRPALAKGAEVDLSIEKIAFGGKALGRVDGFVVFVDHGIPGQTVRVRTQPYMGKIGKLSALRPGLTRLPNGLHAQAAVVLIDENQAVIPLVNLDVIE